MKLRTSNFVIAQVTHDINFHHSYRHRRRTDLNRSSHRQAGSICPNANEVWRGKKKRNLVTWISVLRCTLISRVRIWVPVLDTKVDMHAFDFHGFRPTMSLAI